MVQRNELRGVEQEGRAGHGTSHQTLKGDTCVIVAQMCLGAVAVMTTCLERTDLKKPLDFNLKL